MARPPKSIDANTVHTLASAGCIVAEIAELLDCNKKTLERRFKKEIERGRLIRNASLRRKQFEVAMRGNVAMLIWLGKQYLGQSEKHELTGKDGEPLGPPPQMIVNFLRPDEENTERASIQAPGIMRELTNG